MKATNYIYVSAKIRALENQILDNTDIERMVDAPSLEAAFKVLNDTDYADNLLEIDPINYREVLKNEFQQMFDFLRKVTPQQELLNLILLERDFINIKLLFKAKHFNVNVQDYISKNSVYPESHLKDYIFENHIYPPTLTEKEINQGKSGLDNDIKKVLYRASKIFNDKTRPDEIDAILTQMYFDLMQEKVDKIGSQFIKDFIKMQIDTANVLIWIRAKRLKLDKNRLKSKQIKGGNTNINKLLTLYPEEIKGLKPFINANFDLRVNQAFDGFLESDNLFELEKAMEDWKIRFARISKNYAYGPEVVFGYYIAKQNAIANTRIILTGKLNNLPSEAIKKTLREIF